jgi:hypothetical protein
MPLLGTTLGNRLGARTGCDEHAVIDESIVDQISQSSPTGRDSQIVLTSVEVSAAKHMLLRRLALMGGFASLSTIWKTTQGTGTNTQEA